MMPEIDREHCTLCGDCVTACPEHSLSIDPERGVVLDEGTCVYCGTCEDICPLGLISLPYEIRLARDAGSPPTPDQKQD
ncbi:MAG: 4Fe-4S binding protein [Chloroflexi bacterium]|nr:4Fe-4S binding protein [Chloroflexota bacterium]